MVGSEVTAGSTAGGTAGVQQGVVLKTRSIRLDMTGQAGAGRSIGWGVGCRAVGDRLEDRAQVFFAVLEAEKPGLLNPTGAGKQQR